MKGSNCPEVQKGTCAGTVKKRSVFFIRSFLQAWVIKRGMTKAWVHWGWAKRSLHNNSNVTSMAAGSINHRLAAFRSRNLNMISLVMVFKGSPPKSVPFFVCHQLWTHTDTLLPDQSSAPLLNGMNESGSQPAIIPLVKSPQDNPSTRDAFIRLPEI